MTASGVFPKIDGDAITAYDVNQFGPRIIGDLVGSVSPVINSGTAYQNGGSIYYSGVYPSLMTKYIHVFTDYIFGNSNPSFQNVRLVFSGGNMNFATQPVNWQAFSTMSQTQFYIPYHYLFTSGELTFNSGAFTTPFFIYSQIQTNNSNNNWQRNKFVVVAE